MCLHRFAPVVICASVKLNNGKFQVQANVPTSSGVKSATHLFKLGLITKLVGVCLVPGRQLLEYFKTQTPAPQLLSFQTHIRLGLLTVKTSANSHNKRRQVSTAPLIHGVVFPLDSIQWLK
jgi:hypothetical protein